MRSKFIAKIAVGWCLVVSPAKALAVDASFKLQLSEGQQAIAVRDGANVVLSYNKLPPELPPGIDPIYRRSGFLHPVASPHGGVVTAAYPADHAHQNGIFFAWVKASYDGMPVDFWNLAKGSGRVTHDRVVSTFCERDAVGFVVELVHQIQGDSPVDVLRETWKVTCHRSGNSGGHVFDLESTQQALTDTPLVIEEYHYGGMALRGPSAWIVGKADDGIGLKSKQRPSVFLNSLGSGRAKGNHESANWVAMGGMQNGHRVWVAVLSHQDNFRSPQQARLHPTKPYFCFAPCVGGEFVIDKATPLRSRYRYLVFDREPDRDSIDKLWNAWTSN